MPAHRDLLARRLRVHVDQHVIRAAVQLREHRVGLGERRARGLEVEHARQVHDRQPLPVLLDHAPAAAGRRLRVVGRSHDPFVAVEQLVDVAMAEGVVPKRDRVGAGGEQRERHLRGDSDAASRVLTVDHYEVRLFGLD